MDFQRQTLHQLLQYINEGRYPARARDEIARRARDANKTFADYILNGNSCVDATKSREKPLIKNIHVIIRSIREAKDVGPACEALLDCGWNFIDPARRMRKNPEEVKAFLAGLTTGFPPSWHEMDDGRRGYLTMVMDCYFRAWNVQQTGDWK